MAMYKTTELLCDAHSGDDYEEDFGQNCPICMLKTALYKACERLNDGSAWADESEEFYEMCKLSGHSHPALAAGKNDNDN